jgi:hypothetical protein
VFFFVAAAGFLVGVSSMPMPMSITFLIDLLFQTVDDRQTSIDQPSRQIDQFALRSPRYADFINESLMRRLNCSSETTSTPSKAEKLI